MRHLLQVMVVSVGILFAVPANAATTCCWWFFCWPCGGDTNRKAPEPLTVVGLAAGAATIGAVAWRAKRKR